MYIYAIKNVIRTSRIIDLEEVGFSKQSIYQERVRKLIKVYCK